MFGLLAIGFSTKEVNLTFINSDGSVNRRMGSLPKLRAGRQRRGPNRRGEAGAQCTPAAGWQVVGWTGTDNDTQASVSSSITMPPHPHTVGVVYAPQPQLLTVAKNGSGSGTVTSHPTGIDCGSDCSESYAFGSDVTLTATPDPGSVFAGWSGHTDCLDGVLVMGSEKTCTATFLRALFADGFESGNTSAWSRTSP